MQSSTKPADQGEGAGLLSARETAARLGVKLDTLYAYVSRGLIQSVAAPDSRRRRYRADEVERFRARRGGRGEAPNPVIGSAICLIEDGRFYYRGRDAVALAETATLEEVAALLWGTSDAMPASAPHPPAARVPPSPRQRGEGRGEGLAGLIERCQVRLALRAAEDLAALDLTRSGVIRTGRTILGELVGVVAGDAAQAAPGATPVHRQLAALWQLDDGAADLLRRILVLLADHELNVSTFTARIVASAAATPYAVVSAALGALSGRRHGGAAVRAEALFRELGLADEHPRADPLTVMAARLTRGETLPGIGQPLYPKGDPRAVAIVEAVRAARPRVGARIAAAAVAAVQLTGQSPNVDFALGATTVALGLPAGAALALFVVGRAVGWIAHAIEQYESGELIRPRAAYTGRAR